jgi:hypothetical protein
LIQNDPFAKRKLLPSAPFFTAQRFVWAGSLHSHFTSYFVVRQDHLDDPLLGFPLRADFLRPAAPPTIYPGSSFGFELSAHSYVHEIGAAGNLRFITTEFVDRETLRQHQRGNEAV